MAVLHITEAELAGDLHAMLDRVQAGTEIIVERDARPVAVLRPPASVPSRTISESIAIAKQREDARGYPAKLDPDFAADVEEIVNNRQAWNPPAWD
jgi:antitoxin (DNA-binding transcriptional repressor) of toxin-antitoxin stability system